MERPVVYHNQNLIMSSRTDGMSGENVRHAIFEGICYEIHLRLWVRKHKTGGEGWYQEEGKPAQFLKAGDIIVTHDGVKHWHGATKDSWFEHIAITAGTPEWLEPVDDQTYNKL